MDLTSEAGTHVPTGTYARLIMGAEISRGAALLSQSTDRSPPEHQHRPRRGTPAGNGNHMLSTRVRCALQSSREPAGQAEGPHRVWERKEWDYVSDEKDDIWLIQNSSDVDIDIATAEYDIIRFRLKIWDRRDPFLGGGADSETYNVDLHNYIRDTSGYHNIGRVDEVYRPIERLCWLCLFAEQEGDNESASRGLLTRQKVPVTDAILNLPRKVAARAAAKVRAEAKSMSNKQGNCHMRCQLLKASLRARMPKGFHWGVEPEVPTPRKSSLRAGTATPRA